ncbi:GNAT family N-acetyltransferase [Tepidibacillus fermentans]|uniref:RimJ/RimL family protein N-acetyltransferase n=1 Tax=Tepidibacillus fermentans TaxID=1281767 RepID=A0A4R3KIF9_9BACI|nr:GNAT family N-acetyltransferase [Tepidibacillus fermentans]TCS83149.1 RimJ/RimL family protein N-acetyltransferase [Tepidibacillus fermentans]
MKKQMIELRPFEWKDAKELYEMLREQEVHQYLDMVLNTYQNYEEWLQKIEWLEILGEAYHRCVWNEEEKLIGEIYLINMDQENRRAEMGTWIGRNYWGKGYNRLIKERVLSEAFTRLYLETILLFMQKENQRSIRSLQRLPYITKPLNEQYQDLIKYKEYKLGKTIELLIVKKEDFFSSSSFA